ncbi:MAG: ammonium transporter [Bifidobacteriaceae bacterium]|jgi:Amt family ammonium transporter|nr:ammonium transporter [Bifidobacteriaceae bacterium]
MDTGATAWILTSTALVTLMVPGLAFYYGGMTGFRTALNMLMMVSGAFAVVLVTWVAVGYTIAFGNSVGGAGLIGDPTEFLGLNGLLGSEDNEGLPPLLVAGFMSIFASLTTGIIAGAAADRMKFGAWMVFAGIWLVLVYAPVCHWVFDFDAAGHTGGWIANKLQAIDFAGGTAVHINSGAAGLALALMLGKRRSFDHPPRPHSLPLVLLGALLLWAGWYGFNGGSALAANNAAGVMSANTLFGTGAATLAWLIVEKLRFGHSTALGAASGMVTGLVALTPSGAAVDAIGALLIGGAAGVLCCFAVNWKRTLGYDDSLDVVGIHLVGGLLGTVMIGLLANPAAPNAGAGLFYGGGFRLLGVQILAAVAVVAYSFTVTTAIAFALKKTMGIRVPAETESAGLDVQIHAERAYEIPGAVGD